MTYPRSPVPGLDPTLAWLQNMGSFYSTKLCTDAHSPTHPGTWQVLTSVNSLPPSTILDRCQSIPISTHQRCFKQLLKESSKRCK